MNTADSIRRHIQGLRDEVDRQRTERLAAIDRLEADLLGSVNEPSDEAEDHPHNDQVSSPPSTVGRVFSALEAQRYKTVAELEGEIPELNETQIRAALNAKSMKNRGIERRKKPGKLAGFRRASELSGAGASQISTSQVVLRLLRGIPDGLTAGQISDRILHRISSNAANPKNTISTALYNMKKSGKLAHDEESGVYRVRRTIIPN